MTLPRLPVALALAAAVLGAVAVPAHAQQVTAVISGEITPGVYGRLQIGNTPPPVIYAEPLIVHRAPPGVVMAPVYLYVPPGHAKNWPKHCAKYNACQQPVYFVKEPVRPGPVAAPGTWRADGDRGQGQGRGRGNGHGHDDGPGRGKGHGRHDG